MTLQERQQRANEEFRALLRWASEESEKVSERLRCEGKLPGLDTYREEYEPINREYQHRILALFDKYDLPNKPNFKGLD